LAERFGSRLTVLHTFEVPAYAYAAELYAAADLIGPLREAARLRLEEVTSPACARVKDTKLLVRDGLPAHEILSAVQEVGADLVILGTHGRAGVGRALMGSVAEKVVRLSPVPVLTVHGSSA
jgi:nucleotide-binding universal stress UspA family protein